MPVGHAHTASLHNSEQTLPVSDGLLVMANKA
jgi:hypothetical protein